MIKRFLAGSVLAFTALTGTALTGTAYAEAPAGGVGDLPVVGDSLVYGQDLVCTTARYTEKLGTVLPGVSVAASVVRIVESGFSTVTGQPAGVCGGLSTTVVKPECNCTGVVPSGTISGEVTGPGGTTISGEAQLGGTAGGVTGTVVVPDISATPF